MKTIPIGIDLGTTNTVAYYKYLGVNKALTYNSPSCLLPSVVQYRPVKTIGSSAVNSLIRKDSCVVKNSKRVLGMPYENVDQKYRESLCRIEMVKAPDGGVQFTHYGRLRGETVDSELTFTPVDVVSDIIKYILEQVRERTEMGIGKLTVTCPASFQQEQCLALREAIIKAGVVEGFRIVNELTAAALSYAVENGFKNEIVLVYDIGGGTFDTTVIQIGNGHFRVLASDGDCNIGGVNFDHIIMDRMLEEIEKRFHKSPFSTNPKVAARQKESFIRQCEELKIILSTETHCAFSLVLFASELGIEPDDIRTNIPCYQADIMDWLEDLIKETLVIVDRVLEKANLTFDDISTILFTGGSCQLKCIKNILNNHFGRDICGVTVFVKEIVAHGACIISDIWSQNPSSDSLQVYETIIDS